MADAPLIVLEMYIILGSLTLETVANSSPRPLQESSPELYRSPRLQRDTHRFSQNFCHVGDSLENISLVDCGSCQGRCGALNTMDRQQGLCSCDSACTVYDDCCWDFQQECPEFLERAVEIRNAFDVTPSSICFTMKVLFINSCERTIYAHPEITGTPDPNTQIPVLDLDTGIFYINLKCAICNGAQRLQAVEIHLNYCIPNKYFDVDDFNLKNETTAPPAFSTSDEVVETMATRPDISYSFHAAPARGCTQDVVDQCDETCDNRDLIDLCRNGGQSYTVDLFQFQQYRNIYCALCNFRSVEPLRCSDYLPRDTPTGNIATFSLSFHFDLHELESLSVDPVSLHCESDQIELPDGVVCGATVCPRGYTLHGDTCRANHYMNLPARSELGITTVVLCSISLLGLTCRLILQPFWQQYKSFPGRMQFNLVLAMALYIALLLFSPLASDVDKLCFTLGVLKYFSFLASFVWMTCVAGDTWWALRRRRASQHSLKRPRLLRYLMIGWLLPLVLTLILLSIDLSEADTSISPHFGGRGCWITEKLPLILFFFVPFFISVASNIAFFLLTVRFLKTSFKESDVLRKSKTSQHPWQVYVKLFIIMGLTWLVGCVAIWVDSIVAWFLFVILNASQGIFVFMAFVVKFSKLKTMCLKQDPAPISVKRFSSDHTEPTQTTELHHEAVVTKAMAT